MNILVTGGLGFIGSHVCDRLVELGHKPIVLDRAIGTSKTNHYAVPQRDIRFFLGDVRDFTSVSEAVAISDGVIHLAGVLGTQETIAEPTPAVETNIGGSLNVFRACHRYDKKAVYIAVGNHWMNNPYSITKTTAERFALMFNQEFKTKIAVVRAMNAYGPRQKSHPVRKIIPTFIKQAIDKKPIEIYGDGQQIMDMIYVRDVAEILIRALLVDHGVYNRVFEAGSGEATTVNGIAEMVWQAVNPGTVGLFAHSPMRPGEPPNSTVLANPEQTKNLLYCRKQRVPLVLKSFIDGLAETVLWYRQTPQRANGPDSQPTNRSGEEPQQQNATGKFDL